MLGPSARINVICLSGTKQGTKKQKEKKKQKNGRKLLWVSYQVVSNSYDPMDCSLPGSSIHGILQARILEWVAISFSRESSQPKNRTLGLLHCRQILYRLSSKGGNGDQCLYYWKFQLSLLELIWVLNTYVTNHMINFSDLLLPWFYDLFDSCKTSIWEIKFYLEWSSLLLAKTINVQL